MTEAFQYQHLRLSLMMSLRALLKNAQIGFYPTLSHIDSLAESKKELFLLEDGGHIPIFGELKTINLSRGSFIMCGVDCDNINIVLPDPTDTQMIARTISLLLQSLLTEMLDTLCREIYEDHFEILGIQYPDISLRRMSSRWGSCHVDKHKIVFNKALVFVPEKCIEYVVCHEFTHFLHPDHSIRFYATLERIFPEWRACKAELKKYQSIPDNLF